MKTKKKAGSTQRSAGLLLLCVLGALGGVVFSSLSGQAPPKQAVVETSAGTFVLDLDPAAAPNMTAHFMKLAADGAYEGRSFIAP